MNLTNIGIVFADKNKKVVRAMEKQFSDIMNVQVMRCPLLQISKADCIVCPGNSFGIINDGIEKSITTLIKDSKERIRNVINGIYYGEQPVGTSIIINTFDKNYTHLAYIPIKRHTNDKIATNTPYIIFRSLLTSILNHNKMSDNKIYTILCPVFGVTDETSAREVARQLRIAYGLMNIGVPCSIENAKMINGLLNK